MVRGKTWRDEKDLPIGLSAPEILVWSKLGLSTTSAHCFVELRKGNRRPIQPAFTAENVTRNIRDES